MSDLGWGCRGSQSPRSPCPRHSGQPARGGGLQPATKEGLLGKEVFLLGAWGKVGVGGGHRELNPPLPSRPKEREVLF